MDEAVAIRLAGGGPDWDGCETVEKGCPGNAEASWTLVESTRGLLKVSPRSSSEEGLSIVQIVEAALSHRSCHALKALFRSLTVLVITRIQEDGPRSVSSLRNESSPYWRWRRRFSPIGNLPTCVERSTRKLSRALQSVYPQPLLGLAQ